MSLLEVDRTCGSSSDTEDGVVQAVDGISFAVEAGETLGIVGESGCGKSVTCMSILGLTRGENTEISGHRQLRGRRPGGDGRTTRCARVRGEEIAMIFQDALSALHPFYRSAPS